MTGAASRSEHGPLATAPTRNAVCLCTDRNMLIPALFVAHSVLARTTISSSSFDVIIFCEPSEVTDVHRGWMQEQGILLCDTMDLSGQRGIGKFSGRLTPATLLKLSIARHLAGRYDRLLYLDCDLTVHDDVGSLFSLSMGGHALAAVPAARMQPVVGEEPPTAITQHFQALGMTAPYRYFNSGVMLIDVEKWNRAQIGQRCLAFVRENPELCPLPDEDSLNATLDGDMLDISPVWNVHPSLLQPRGARGPVRPVILHHSGDDKPWRRYGYRKRLFPDRSAYRLYREFVTTTPWPGWLRSQWTLRDLRANIEWELRRVTRRLRGRLDEPSAAERRRRLEWFDRYCAEAWFADVEQGLVTRQDGILGLSRRGAAQ